eukprot:3191921-Prymnesium_polylepis.1
MTAFRRLRASPEPQNRLVPMSRLQSAGLRFLSGFGRSCSIYEIKSFVFRPGGENIVPQIRGEFPGKSVTFPSEIGHFCSALLLARV